MGGATESRENQWLAWSVAELRLKCKLVCLRGQCALCLSSPCAMWTFYPWMLGILECQLQILIFHQINQVIREVTLRCSGKYRKLSIFSFLFLFHNIGFLLKSPPHWPLIIASPPPPAPLLYTSTHACRNLAGSELSAPAALGLFGGRLASLSSAWRWKGHSESLQTVVMTKNNWAAVFFTFHFKEKHDCIWERVLNEGEKTPNSARSLSRHVELWASSKWSEPLPVAGLDEILVEMHEGDRNKRPHRHTHSQNLELTPKPCRSQDWSYLADDSLWGE